MKSARVPSRIVVRGTNWVGDTVMSIPAIREVRRIFPDAWIELWGPAGLKPLLHATRVPDGVIAVNTHAAGPLRRPFLVKRDLAAGRFDMAILFQNAFRERIHGSACGDSDAGGLSHGFARPAPQREDSLDP